MNAMMRVARRACRRAGYPVNDPEYGSVIGVAVFKAARYWSADRGCKPTTMAAICAKRLCRQLEIKLDRRARRDMVAGLPGARANLKGRMHPVHTPIPLNDFEVLSFVAAHGIGKSAKLLAMTPALIRERLDEVRLRMKRSQVD
jgi:hypothetical protein